MRKPGQLSLIAAVVVLLATSGFLLARNQKTANDLSNAKVSEAQVQDRYSRTIEAIAEIQDSLNTISVGPEGAAQFEGSLQAERRAGGPNRSDALERIAVLRESIGQSKQRIQKLESEVKKGGVKVAGLERLIANLKQSAAEKEALVAQLSTQVDALQTQVTGLTATVQETQNAVQERDVQLEDKRRELATVFYVVGSKKELSRSGVIQSKGGVLGVGKTVLPAPVPNETAFTPLDTDQETVIRTPGAKARVISAQPSSSYELRLVDGQIELHILSPSEFRKVKQVVILTS